MSFARLPDGTTLSVELEGAGPVYASDGAPIAETHAPKRTIRTIR